MEPPLCGSSQRLSATTSPAADVSVRLQQQLAAAIRGALEVAVEIAVREVTELVGQTTGDIWEHIRRENESLRQRLRRAEQELLQLDRCGSPAESRLMPGTHTDEPPPHAPGAAGADPGTGVAAACEDEPAPGREDKDVSSKERCDAASSQPEERRNAADDTSERVPHACAVKVENVNRPCPDDAAPRCRPSPPPTAEGSTTEQVTVKLEEEDEEQREGSACCLDAIKLEDFSPECAPDVQSINLYEWNPEMNDICHGDPKTRLPCAQLTKGHRSNPTTGLPPPTDLPSLSSEFADILQLAETSRPPEASPQVYGVHVRTSCNIANLYACKTCSQTFHLPSLLRRHSGLCQRQLQQFCSPAAGSKRTRLQLYPPGCSPFRCTECNREFNRMENLKTHLRIHTGERPYTCSVCAKCFRHSGALTRHFRIHTGEKPYICGQCGKSFRNCGGLKFHQRSHSKSSSSDCR